jgi:hypothetical protein
MQDRGKQNGTENSLNLSFHQLFEFLEVKRVAHGNDKKGNKTLKKGDDMQLRRWQASWRDKTDHQPTIPTPARTYTQLSL